MANPNFSAPNHYGPARGIMPQGNPIYGTTLTPEQIAWIQQQQEQSQNAGWGS